MTRYIRREVKKAPPRDFPLLYNPRPLSMCGTTVVPGRDARWRNVTIPPVADEHGEPVPDCWEIKITANPHRQKDGYIMLVPESMLRPA